MSSAAKELAVERQRRIDLEAFINTLRTFSCTDDTVGWRRDAGGFTIHPEGGFMAIITGVDPVDTVNAFLRITKNVGTEQS